MCQASARLLRVYHSRKVKSLAVKYEVRPWMKCSKCIRQGVSESKCSNSNGISNECIRTTDGVERDAHSFIIITTEDDRRYS